MKTIMIVEDEPAISHFLSAYIKKAGYDCIVFARGNEAMNYFDRQQPALILLDVMLPGMNGWEVLREIRLRNACPVIMLTARNDISDRLMGLNNGADDYITKPFEPDEVVARIHAVLRRTSPLLISQDQRHYGSLRIDFKSRTVYLNGAIVSITPKDLVLLLFLADNPNQVFHREQLIERVWGRGYDGSDRAVDNAIKRLRKALLHLPPEDGELRTLRGTGYQFYAKQHA